MRWASSLKIKVFANSIYEKNLIVALLYISLNWLECFPICFNNELHYSFPFPFT